MTSSINKRVQDAIALSYDSLKRNSIIACVDFAKLKYSTAIYYQADQREDLYLTKSFLNKSLCGK
jgi:hypothetical protein